MSARLAFLLEAGELVHERAALIDSLVGVASFRRLHRSWVLACLVVLAHGFEPEAVSEFLNINIRIGHTEDPKRAARAAVGATRDALELLRGLRATL